VGREHDALRQATGVELGVGAPEVAVDGDHDGQRAVAHVLRVAASLA